MKRNSDEIKQLEAEWQASLSDPDFQKRLLSWGISHKIINEVPTNPKDYSFAIGEIYSRITQVKALKKQFGDGIRIVQHPLRAHTDMTVSFTVEGKYRVCDQDQYPDHMLSAGKYDELKGKGVYYLNTFNDGGYYMWDIDRSDVDWRLVSHRDKTVVDGKWIKENAPFFKADDAILKGGANDR